MNSSRRWIVNGFIWVFLGLVAFSIRSKREFWPICNYPMFDRIYVHPNGEKVEFYTQLPGREEKRVQNDEALGQLNDELVLKAILQRNGWPSEKSKDGFRRVVETMRTARETNDSAWAGPVTLRAYDVHYALPQKEELPRQVTGKTLLLELVDHDP